MNATSVSHWPGVRETFDGRFSFTVNVSNTLYIEDGFYDAESAALALDAAKYNFVQSGHLRRSNYYFFPDIVAKWVSDEVVNPQPNSDMCKFMAANHPRYVPVKQRVKIFPMPSAAKMFSVNGTLTKLLGATAARLTPEQRLAVQETLELVRVLALQQHKIVT